MLAASMFRIPIKGRPLIRQSPRREKACTATGDVPRPPSWDRRRGRWSDERRIRVSRPHIIGELLDSIALLVPLVLDVRRSGVQRLRTKHIALADLACELVDVRSKPLRQCLVFGTQDRPKCRVGAILAPPGWTLCMPLWGRRQLVEETSDYSVSKPSSPTPMSSSSTNPFSHLSRTHSYQPLMQIRDWMGASPCCLRMHRPCCSQSPPRR